MKKQIALTAALVASSILVSCDGDSTSGTVAPTIEFPKTLQANDTINLSNYASIVFTDALTATWGADTLTLGAYKPDRSESFVSFRNLNKDTTTIEDTFNTSVISALQEFNSPLRTIILKSQEEERELTEVELITISGLLNAGAGNSTPDTVVYDTELGKLIYTTEYNLDLDVTSDITSFFQGRYTGNYTISKRGLEIRFRSITNEEKDAFRLGDKQLIPEVTTKVRDIQEIEEGTFNWNLAVGTSLPTTQ